MIFNDRNFFIPPQEGSPQAKYFQLIEEAINSGNLKTFDLPQTPRNYRLLLMNEPFQPEFNIYNRWLKSSDAYFWAVQVRCHITENVQITDNSPVEVTKNYKLPSEFIKMGEEIQPECAEQLAASAIWTIQEFVRIIFGEKYKTARSWDSTVSAFDNLIKQEIKARNLAQVRISLI